ILTPDGSRFERPPQAFLHRLEMDRELASQARRSDMRKAQEIEGRRLDPGSPCLTVGRAPKFDQTCLLGMQGQSELREPLVQDSQHSLGILPVLKTQKPIVGVTNFERLTLQSRSEEHTSELQSPMY